MPQQVLLASKPLEALQAIRESLEASGHSVVVADDVDDVLGLARAHRVDLVVLTEELEGGTGADVCAVLAGLPGHSPLLYVGPVLVPGADAVAPPDDPRRILEQAASLLEGAELIDSLGDVTGEATMKPGWTPMPAADTKPSPAARPESGEPELSPFADEEPEADATRPSPEPKGKEEPPPLLAAQPEVPEILWESLPLPPEPAKAALPAEPPRPEPPRAPEPPPLEAKPAPVVEPPRAEVKPVETKPPARANGSGRDKAFVETLLKKIREADYFEILGVTPDSDTDAVVAAHASLRTSLDELGSAVPRAQLEEAQAALDEARDVLGEPSLRAAYARNRL